MAVATASAVAAIDDRAPSGHWRSDRWEANNSGHEDDDDEPRHRQRSHRDEVSDQRAGGRAEDDASRHRDEAPRHREDRDEGRSRARRDDESRVRSSRHSKDEEENRRRDDDRYRRRERDDGGGDERRDKRDWQRDHDERDRDRDRKRDRDARANKEEEPGKAVQRENEKAGGRSGGVYIPPFKLAQMMSEVKDKSSVEYQRMTWDALKKSINGHVNKVNSSNIKNILPELFSENLIRGRGLFARSCMKSQMASPAFTHVFAALVAVVNTKFPELGELLLKRIILQLRRAFKRNDKPILLAVTKFIAHLVNQQVAHEVIALELLTLLLDNPTDDSVEVAVGFVKECGAQLQEVSPQPLHMIFDRFRAILHEGEIDKRVQFMIEGVFAIRKANFQGNPAILPDLDLVEPEDQITHQVTLDEDLDQEIHLDIFKPDPNFTENEKKYELIKKEILGDEEEEEEEDGSGSGSDEDEDEEDDDDPSHGITDHTETNLVNLRRTIYLTIMSSVDFEEAGHKLLKIKLEPGQEKELCIMLLECCSQERTYLRYYGLLGQRFCMINRVFQEFFDGCFLEQYSMIHRLETNKLRNVAKFFGHLLGTDALPWKVLGYINLTEEATTSSSRIFIKILFQELSEHLGLRKLNERLTDPLMQEHAEGVFPRDNPKNTRFAINFFTSIGLGGLTDNLREYLKNMPRLIMEQQKPAESEDSESGSSSSSSGSESSSSGSSSSSDSDSDSESEDSQPRKKRKK